MPAPILHSQAVAAGASDPIQAGYDDSIRRSCRWLIRSERPAGGSAAYWAPLFGWSSAYPETTGYIIPTLIRAKDVAPQVDLVGAALRMGEWLLSIQSAAGWWPGGRYPSRGAPAPSIFNTGQILQGMEALARHTGEERWRLAATGAARWLAAGVDDGGCWRHGHYRPGFQPAYYTRVAWPMLQVAQLAGDDFIRDAAVRVLDCALRRALPNGAFEGWGFSEDQAAFTHTIAYTIEGFLAAGALLGEEERFVRAVMPAIDRLYRQAELNNGRLPGSFDQSWKPERSYVCVTGSAQTAICLLLLDRAAPDLRLVSAAAKLCDANVAIQGRAFHRAMGGDLPGSDPPTGAYMRGRYPNWATKFHIDALLMLRARLRREWGG